MFEEEIKKVRALLDSPEAWTQISLAKNEKDETTCVFSDDACKWCVQGAFMHVTNATDQADDDFDDVWRYIDSKSVEITGMYLVDFNDDVNTDYYDVLEFIDKVLYV